MTNQYTYKWNENIFSSLALLSDKATKSINTENVILLALWKVWGENYLKFTLVIDKPSLKMWGSQKAHTYIHLEVTQ